MPIRPRRESINLPALTGLRFFLALWVVLHHLTGRNMMLEAWVNSLPPAFGSLIHSGYVAVGTFFVLSGFVLALTYSSGEWNQRSLLRYGLARVARIYPVYLLSVVVMAPFILVERLPWAQKAGLVANYGLLLQGWTGKLPVNWNTPAWSLSCELFFYACFPVLALLIVRARPAALVAVGVLACGLDVAFRKAGVPDMWKPVLHLADFLLGIVVARTWARLRHLTGRGAWIYLPASVLFIALIVHQEILYGWVFLNTGLRPLNGLLLLGFGLGGGLLARFLSTRPVVFLGKASYSLYILHVPVLWWYKRWAWVALGPIRPEANAFLYVMTAVAISAIVYHFIEEPANRYLRARISR